MPYYIRDLEKDPNLENYYQILNPKPTLGTPSKAIDRLNPSLSPTPDPHSLTLDPTPHPKKKPPKPYNLADPKPIADFGV